MEIKETGISRFTSVEEIVTALNGHFKTVFAEKHQTAMINFILSRCADKILGNCKKSRVSASVEAKLRDTIIKELRKYYGEWANIYQFSIKRAEFRTNFDLIFKTEFGRLYGSSPGTIHDHLFFTSHCFDQYKTRCDCFKEFPMLTLAYRRTMMTAPTSADILRFMAVNAKEFCQDEKFIYVNVETGVLVFEKLSRGVLIAKTFLLPDMDFPKKGWYYSGSSGFNLDLTDDGKEIAKTFERVPITKPCFIKKEEDYKEIVKILKIPVLNS